MTRRHRGSSPPFQEPEQGEFDWMTTPSPHAPYDHPGIPFQDIKPDENTTEQSRWQDDGGESGEKI
jgi:hypothetical protein